MGLRPGIAPFLLISGSICLCASYYVIAVDVALLEFALFGKQTPTSLMHSGPCFDLGEAELRNKYRAFLNFTRVRIFDENVTTCDQMDQKATFWASRYFYREAANDPVMAIFGPACQAFPVSVGHLAREWNQPLLIPTAGDAAVSNKKRFPTLTRLSPYIQEDLNILMFRLLENYRYTVVGILCDDASDILRIYVPMCSALFDNLRLTYNVSASRFYIRATDSVNTTHYLNEMKSVARVIIIIAHGNRVRPIMLAASDLGMTGGDYVYFTFELFPSKTFFGNISWNTENKDGRDERCPYLKKRSLFPNAKEAYRSLFVISLSNQNTPKYDNFTTQVKQLSREKYGYHYEDDEEVNPFAVSYYYALQIYAEVLNKAAAIGGNLQDGARLTKLMWNRTYTILGKKIVINANGDRDNDWALQQMDHNTGLFRPVMEYSAVTRLLLPTTESNGTVRQINWHNRDGPPPNEPKCGYRGLKIECEIERRRLLSLAPRSNAGPPELFFLTIFCLFCHYKVTL